MLFFLPLIVLPMHARLRLVRYKMDDIAKLYETQINNLAENLLLAYMATSIRVEGCYGPKTTNEVMFNLAEEHYRQRHERHKKMHPES